jgi:peptidyl-dipeptidase A
MKKHPFQQFLSEFIPVLAKKSKQVGLASWILETTGTNDASSLLADLNGEYRLLFNCSETYQKLLAWDKEDFDPILKRQLNILIRAFKQNQVPKALLESLSQKEAALAQSYSAFRPQIGGEDVSENDIRTILKEETNVAKRKEAWEASKKIGAVLAPQILELVKTRNEAAHALGYSDYFQMQLDLQEVDPKWLLDTLQSLAASSKTAYEAVLNEVNASMSERFGTTELGPWAWSEPFCQEDPLDNQALDSLVEGVDLAKAGLAFYKQMNIDVSPILDRSDMKERPKKNQHAFCINIDRADDIRTLNNVCASIKWLETVLHELGHAIYETGYDSTLPWLLREPPHMITTEAMALLAGRQAYMRNPLKVLVGPSTNPVLERIEDGLKRRQLVFSRWVLVMTEFESSLYCNPDQDLNSLWWNTVEKYQGIKAPSDRSGKFDWACKYHIGLAPVYYFSYLLGEMFASSIQATILKECGDSGISTEKAGRFLFTKLFAPGNSMPWNKLIEHVTGSSLAADAWLKEFC